MLRSTWRRIAGMAGLVWGSMFTTLGAAAPVSLEYELVALGTPGRYEYHYTLSNVSLAAPLSWFSVDFDSALYEESSLLVTSAGLSQWSEQILGSVFANPAQYDAYNTLGAGLAIGESMSGFSVEFTWLGAGTPGSQAFTVYGYDDAGMLAVLDIGVSMAAVDPPPTGVPEPNSVALAGLALGALLSLRARGGTRTANRLSRPCAIPA